MVGIYTQPLVTLNAAGTFDQVVYRVPDGQHVVLRDFCVTLGGTSGTFQIYLQTGLGPVPYLYIVDSTEPFHHLGLRQAMVAGEELHVASTWPSAQVAITGYRFLEGASGASLSQMSWPGVISA